MEAEKISMGRLISALVSLARKSGQFIQEVQASGQLHVQMKGYNDPCTLADTESQKVIQETLWKIWPNLTIIGEEDLQREPSAAVDLTEEQLNAITEIDEKWRNVDISKVVVWIDPLDGTLEFTRGDVQCVTTLLGIAYEDEAIAGVINKPFMKQLMWGCRDTGVYIQEQEEGNWQKLEPKKLEKMIIAVTKSHKSERTELAKQLIPADEFREIGGSGSKTWAVIVSEVSVQLYPSNGTKKWDTCAPEALIRALGGNLTDIYGQKYLYNKNIDLPNLTGVLASLFDHESLVEALKSIPKSQDR